MTRSSQYGNQQSDGPPDRILEFDYLDGPWTVSMNRLIELSGLTRNAVFARLRKGWSFEDTFNPDGAAVRTRRRSIERYGLRFLYHWGQVKPVEDWAVELNLDARLLHKKLTAGWTTAELLNPTAAKARRVNQIRARQGKYLTYQGKTQVMGEWARELGMMRITLRERLKNGWKNSGMPWTYQPDPEHMRIITNESKERSK